MTMENVIDAINLSLFLTLNIFTHGFGVSIDDLEQVNTDWFYAQSKYIQFRNQWLKKISLKMVYSDIQRERN